MQFEFFDEKPSDFLPPKGFGVSTEKLSQRREQNQLIQQQHPRQAKPAAKKGATSGKGVSHKKGGAIDRRQSSRGQGGKPQQPISTEPVEPLKVSENRWIRPADDESDEVPRASRAYRGLLNKLTLEKFDIISAEILQYPMTSKEVLLELINLVFDKATDEAHFSSMYAQLCEKIQGVVPNFEDKTVTFRKILLTKCQKEFETKPGEAVTDLLLFFSLFPPFHLCFNYIRRCPTRTRPR